MALAFLYAALTGLSLWSPRLYWLASVFGGGITVRAWHPWGGLLFVVSSRDVRPWRGQMRLDCDDRRWLRRAHRYAVHEKPDCPKRDASTPDKNPSSGCRPSAAVLS